MFKIIDIWLSISVLFIFFLVQTLTFSALAILCGSYTQARMYERKYASQFIFDEFV